MCYECTLLVEIAIHPWPSVYYKTIYNTLYGGHIEGLGTIGERGLGVVGGRVFDYQLATGGSCEHCYWRVMIHVRRLLGTFSISAYPVC